MSERFLVISQGVREEGVKTLVSHLSGGVLVLVVVGVFFGCMGAPVASAEEVFGVESFGVFPGGGFEGPVAGSGIGMQAGSHPAALTTTFVFNHSVVEEKEEPVGEEPKPVLVREASSPKNLMVNLPGGVVVDPLATPTRCTEAQLEGGSCPISSAVGVVRASITEFPYWVFGPLYNMVAPAGSPGQFGANLARIGFVVHVNGHVRAGDYALSAEATEITKEFPPYAISATLWGSPSGSSHDSERGACGEQPRVSKSGESCPVEQTETALLTAPGSCTGEPLLSSSAVESWQQPEVAVRAVASWPQAIGCARQQFEPSIEVQPEQAATGSATGLHVDVHFPQNDTLNGTGEADLRDAKITLAEGMSINPASAGGRSVCSPTEIGLEEPSQRWAIAVERSVVRSFTLAYAGQQTTAIAAGAPAVTLQQALEALPAIGAGGVTVSPVGGGYEATLTGHQTGALTGQASDDAYQLLDVQGTAGTFSLELEGQATASLPYYIHAEEVQAALEAIVGAGNVMVAGGGSNDVYTGERAPYTIVFTGALAGEEPPVAASSTLTGPGAGVKVTSSPAAQEPLAVRNENGGMQFAGKTIRFAEKVPNPQTGVPEATACPAASKIGAVEITTPLLGHPLPGLVYLAEQEHNPFDSLFAIYLVIEDPTTGVIVKLAGHVEPNETTGQIATTFLENPQLPVEDVKVELYGGTRAPLVTPPHAGSRNQLASSPHGAPPKAKP